MPDNGGARHVESPWGELTFRPVDREPRPRAEEGAAAAGAPRTRADGGRRASRAAQFMPFAALTGYYDLVRAQERIVEERHELTEEEAAALSRAINQTMKGDLVRVTYYDRDGYVTRTGIVAGIEVAYRRLHLSGLTIAFDDIREIERRGHGRP